MTVLNTIARPLLAVPFVASGWDALVKPEGHRERARQLYALIEGTTLETRLGLTAPSNEVLDFFARLAGGTFVGAGLALALSKTPRVAALVLAAGQVPVVLANNPVWLAHGEERQKYLLGLAQSAGLIGGALIVASNVKGRGQ
ncbi:MAG: DoxX family membrane protein [Actinomycetaceae bacterium]|nr:DoxX family membrane protein [Actinomycetaceae bacterium]